MQELRCSTVFHLLTNRLLQLAEMLPDLNEKLMLIEIATIEGKIETNPIDHALDLHNRIITTETETDHLKAAEIDIKTEEEDVKKDRIIIDGANDNISHLFKYEVQKHSAINIEKHSTFTFFKPLASLKNFTVFIFLFDAHSDFSGKRKSVLRVSKDKKINCSKKFHLVHKAALR